VTDGETNASLTRGDRLEHMSPERAFELLAARRANPPQPKTTAKPKQLGKAKAKSKAPATAKTTSKPAVKVASKTKSRSKKKTDD
ncbi:MAG: topoisomerase C-terminal repeat-containing protein, partial [Actinomycetota bacterium]